MTNVAIGRLSAGIELDTDAVGPDSLKAAFTCAIDALLSRADKHLVAIDWNTLEVALHRTSDADSNLVVRAMVLR